jgi:hypothetical protein
VIRVQKSLTISAVCAWVESWANNNTKVITPSGRTYSLERAKLSHQAYFIYFILNQDSNAIKIGRAKNLEKRLKTLQTSSPARLQLVKFIQVNCLDEAEALEKFLHNQFNALKLTGEWFRAEAELLEYIQNIKENHP